MANLRDFIEQHTTYPYELIQSNVDRLGCGEPAWVRPTRHTVLADWFVDAVLDLATPRRGNIRRKT
jgi:hypothetical protein